MPDLVLAAYYFFSYSAPMAAAALCIMQLAKRRDRFTLLCLLTILASLGHRICLNVEYFSARFLLARSYFFDHWTARLAYFGSYAALFYLLPTLAYALAGRRLGRAARITSLALAGAALACIAAPAFVPRVYSRIRLILALEQGVAAGSILTHAYCAVSLLAFSARTADASERSLLRLQGIAMALFVPVQILEAAYSLRGLVWPRPLSADYLLFFLWCILSIAQYARRAQAGRPTTTDSVPDSFAAAYGISEREREIIVLLARGLANKEIGAALSISEKTVKNHVYSVYRKTGVQARVALVRKLMEHAQPRP